MFDLSSLFGKKSVKNPFEGFTDFHSHILPGVDDGVGDMDDSLAILDDYERRGFAEVWLTPHIMEDVPNRPAELRVMFDRLCAAYNGNIKLHLAAENMIDCLFMERLEAGEVLPIGHEGDMLLVETSFFQPPIDLENALECIRAKGLTPVLAHPERYNYIDTLDRYKALVNMGVRLQMNIFSLAGQYGPMVRKKAEDIAAAGLYSYAGTDIHRMRQLPLLDLRHFSRRHIGIIESINRGAANLG